MIVALDGPAGSGKSTTARRVADRLGWLYLDTGAMYRAVGLAFGEKGLPFTDDAAAALVPGLTIGLVPAPDGVRVSLGGEDVTARIRTPEAAEAASRASALGPVRDAMVAQQRAVARAHEATGSGVVVEGRDIGTVVFPDAAVKFFLVADLDARARRRFDDLVAAVARTELPVPSFETVRAEIAARDARDQTRDLAPLHAAPDAVVLDTTVLSVDDQVETVVQAALAATASQALHAPTV
ncbi:MAG TPA: (d)CMP kinase [Rubricoccaceae bacterium]